MQWFSYAFQTQRLPVSFLHRPQHLFVSREVGLTWQTGAGYHEQFRSSVGLRSGRCGVSFPASSSSRAFGSRRVFFTDDGPHHVPLPVSGVSFRPVPGPSTSPPGERATGVVSSPPGVRLSFAAGAGTQGFVERHFSGVDVSGAEDPRVSTDVPARRRVELDRLGSFSLTSGNAGPGTFHRAEGPAGPLCKRPWLLYST